MKKSNEVRRRILNALEKRERIVREKITLKLKNFQDPEKQEKLEWIVNYLVEENFPPEHLNAISKIVGLFNDCEDSETEIFKFVDRLYKKYVGVN